MAKRRKNAPRIAVPISGERIPKASESILGNFQPKAVEQARSMSLKAAWRVNKIQMADPYGWHDMDSQTLGYIRGKLSAFESMTWNEIFTVAKKQNHSISVESLKCRDAKRWMQENMPDQTELWTLRLSGKERIWGVFAEGAYLIVFWDPNHKIMPTLQ